MLDVHRKVSGEPLPLQRHSRSMVVQHVETQTALQCGLELRVMQSLLSLHHGGIDLTCDGSFDGEPAFRGTRAAPQNVALQRPRSLDNTTSILPQSAWIHGLVLAAIIVVGFFLAQLFSTVVDAGLLPANPTFRFLQNNMSTFVVGFGFALYGCRVNRQLQCDNQRRDFLGPYKLMKLIGSGGMGEVYLAEHELLKRRCAVKLIRSDKASNRKMLARFEREVKATAQLTHWNTVQVYDYGCTTEGTFYYAMEYLQGLNLRQLVEENGALPAGRVIFILRQLCGALHEAALFGLVHRDIKPSNIFLTERGQMFDIAKLLDFGLVRPASFGTCPIRNVSRQLQGSPRFMCPEQAQGQKPDCRGDLYSLACVAYFLLTGRAPFENDNPVLLVVAHAQTPPSSFEDIGVSVPSDLASIIMRCLNKDPADRFQSPRDLQDALDQCRDAHDWTWRDAENWWLDHPEETHLQPGEPGSAAETTPSVSIVASEPDETFVCNERSNHDSHC